MWFLYTYPYGWYGQLLADERIYHAAFDGMLGAFRSGVETRKGGDEPAIKPEFTARFCNHAGQVAPAAKLLPLM